MAQWIFPLPHDYSPASPPLLCDRERVLGLYTQETGTTASNLTQKVEEWFIQAAFTNGWAAAAFVSHIQTGINAGCILMSSHALQHARATGNPTIRRVGQ